MNKSALIKWITWFVFSAACAFAQSPGSSNAPSAGSTLRRVPVDADSAAALLVQKEPPNYPEAARKAGIQGTVVLKVATAYSGDVKEVTVVSGDPVLAQAAADTVMKWKYRPYLRDGSPAKMETQVSIGFHFLSVSGVTRPHGV